MVSSALLVYNLPGVLVIIESRFASTPPQQFVGPVHQLCILAIELALRASNPRR